MSDELTIEQIREIIPHRYPFLFIDRVTEIKEVELIKGYKNITANEPVFQGHFPDKPVFPGVLIIEAMAQLGAILILKNFPKERRMAYFAGIEKARFKRLVVPGDKLEFTVEVIRNRGSFAVIQGKATVDGEMAAEATLMSSVAK
jgi:3-hydroxyacyl-[acyl-carrier-protein] dehydratase